MIVANKPGRRKVISMFVFYSELCCYLFHDWSHSILQANRYKSERWVQTVLFLLAMFGGSRLVWLVNRGNWIKVMQQVRRSTWLILDDT